MYVMYANKPWDEVGHHELHFMAFILCWRLELIEEFLWETYTYSGSLCPKDNFRSEFMEISKAVHFLKAYNARNPKTNVYICAETQVAAILDFQNGRREIRIFEYLGLPEQ